MRSRRLRQGRLLLAAALVLGLGALVAPASAPPLYDGVNYPDEPYRFVDPPAGAPKTKPATTASATAPVSGGRAGELKLATAENAPQISIDLPAGAVRTPDGVTSVRVTAAPVGNIAVPAGRYLWSDVYDVSATRGTVSAVTDAQGQPIITMRAVNAQRPEPVIARFDGARWTLLPTFAVGNDIYSAQFPGLGRFAVLGIDPLRLNTTGSGDQGLSGNTGILVVIGVLVVVVALIGLSVRRRLRARRASLDPAGDTSGDDEPDASGDPVASDGLDGPEGEPEEP